MQDVYDRDDVQLIPLDVLEDEGTGVLLTDEFDEDGEHAWDLLDRFGDRQSPFRAY